MSTDLENITASFGLVRREFRDVHAVVSRLDHQVRRLIGPPDHQQRAGRQHQRAVAATAAGDCGTLLAGRYQIIAVDAAAFASSLGPPDFNVSDDPSVHMESTPLPIGTAGLPATVAAPTQSLWQTAAIGLRCLIDADWTLRRSGAVATIRSVTW